MIMTRPSLSNRGVTSPISGMFNWSDGLQDVGCGLMRAIVASQLGHRRSTFLATSRSFNFCYDLDVLN
jgi:hypothetical protein